MTFRERIADWLTGGAYSRLVEVDDGRMEALADACVVINSMEDALTEIAASETPGANATVKRMARIAREALG